MKVLLVGGGGREHALAWKIAQSPLLSTLYCSPGNPGIDNIRVCRPIVDHDIAGIVAFAEAKSVDVVVVGPEAPLAQGIADALRQKAIACFGPSAAAAQLESSKGFMKDICAEHNIPTARYQRVKSTAQANDFLDTLSAPYVIKADGLAAGKGVVIAQTRAQANDAVSQMLDGQFGEASAEIVIEEFLHGEEVSFFVICDGKRALPLIGSQDHKRVGEGDTGPNTGGMGAYSPAAIFDEAMRARTMNEIIDPTLDAMAQRGTPFTGVLFAGLMITSEGPKLIEYNVRFGDPECQVMMRRMTSDILPVLKAAADGDLEGQTVQWSDDAAALIVLAAKGYPGDYEKGSVIRGVDDAASVPDIEIFHAGTRLDNGVLHANGGRVLNVTATGKTLPQALKAAYAGVDKINWQEGFYRRDIGWRAKDHEKNEQT